MLCGWPLTPELCPYFQANSLQTLWVEPFQGSSNLSCLLQTPAVFLSHILGNSVNLKPLTPFFPLEIQFPDSFLKDLYFKFFPLFFPARLGRYLKESFGKASTSRTLLPGRHVYDVL